MGAKRQNITLDHGFFIGTDRTIKIKVTEDDETTAQVMTGFALTWELKESPTGTVLITKSTGGDGITIVNGDGTNDEADIVLADEDTEGLTPGLKYHHLRRTDAGSELVLTFGDAHLRASGIT